MAKRLFPKRSRARSSGRSILEDILFPAIGVFVGASPIFAQTSPGHVPDDLVGDWSCEGTQVYITRLASIEILDEGYIAGLFDADNGRMEIAWDSGDRASWHYRQDSPAELVLTRPDGSTLTCEPGD